MAITVSGLRSMNTASIGYAADSFAQASKRYSEAEDSFLSEVASKIHSPDVWEGGGQGDASIVMDVNASAMAIGRLEMEAAAKAFRALQSAMSTAQSSLESSLSRASSKGITVSEDGSAKADIVWDKGPSKADVAEEIELEVKGQLVFASLADASCKGLLDYIASQVPKAATTADFTAFTYNSDLLDKANELVQTAGENERFWDAAEPEPLPPENALADLGGGVVNLFDNLRENPGDSAELLLDAGITALGVVLVLLGAGAEVGGITISATGVGAVVGVPAAVAGAGVVATGLALAGVGAYELGQDLNRLSKNDDKPSSGSGGPPRYKPGDNSGGSRTYAKSTSDAKGQAKTYAERMEAKGYRVEVPPVRYDKYGHSDVTVTVYKKDASGDWKIHHIRHFVYKG